MVNFAISDEREKKMKGVAYLSAQPRVGVFANLKIALILFVFPKEHLLVQWLGTGIH